MFKRLDAKAKVTLLLLAVIVVLLALMSMPLGQFIGESQDRQVQIMEEAISSALLQCYALEGSYPPDLAYLQEHYGVMLNEAEYYYQYEVFASNVQPQIIVTPKHSAK